ncbi:MAG: transposase [Rickettsiales bacterium]|jgi:hypothetical protein|nr:transposase [Rickettsiales bacterium]
MHIICADNHGRPYLQVVECYSVFEDGKRKDKKRCVRCIGLLDKFDDGQPNFLKRLRASFRQGTPIIKELEDLVPGNPVDETLTLSLTRKYQTDVSSDGKNIGYFLLDSLYDYLGIYDVLALEKSRISLNSLDINGITKLLIFGRILDPASKCNIFSQKDSYLFPVSTATQQNDVYDTLDIINKKSTSIVLRMNNNINLSVSRSTNLCYYDITNYYFEIHKNDADVFDADGSIIQLGLRKSGMSKENRRQPIVQMGLFIDDNGLPIAYNLFPGNTNDQITLQPTYSKKLAKMNFGRIVVVADAGVNSKSNIISLINTGHGYIFPKSIKKAIKRLLIGYLTMIDTHGITIKHINISLKFILTILKMIKEMKRKLLKSLLAIRVNNFMIKNVMILTF